MLLNYDFVAVYCQSNLHWLQNLVYRSPNFLCQYVLFMVIHCWWNKMTVDGTIFVILSFNFENNRRYRTFATVNCKILHQTFKHVVSYLVSGMDTWKDTARLLISFQSCNLILSGQRTYLYAQFAWIIKFATLLDDFQFKYMYKKILDEMMSLRVWESVKSCNNHRNCDVNSRVCHLSQNHMFMANNSIS